MFRPLLASLLVVPLLRSPSHAQIVPAPDSLGTQTELNGDRIDIIGGQISSDGQNLFHDFAQFDLSADRLATFITPGEIRNILSRIGSGPSTIDGTISIAGSNANLFLMNPQGKRILVGRL